LTLELWVIAPTFDQQRHYFVDERVARQVTVGVTAAWNEWNDPDRRPKLGPQCRDAADHRAWPGWAEAVSPNRFAYMLEEAEAQIPHLCLEVRRELTTDIGRHHDLTRACQRCQPGGKVDPAPVQIVFAGDELADMNARPEQHLTIRWQSRVRGSEGEPNGARCTDGRGHGGKLEHEPIAHVFDEPAIVSGENVAFHSAHERPPSLHQISLVGFHEPHGLDQIHE
jgi:hypothetical protein